MLKMKHVFILSEGTLYLLIGPVNEQFIVEIRFLSQTSCEVDWVLKVSPVPVRLQQYAQLLGPSQGKHWNENFSPLVQRFVNRLKKLSLSTAFGVSNGCCVGCLSDAEIWPQFVYPCRTQVPVCSHVVVSCIHN